MNRRDFLTGSIALTGLSVTNSLVGTEPLITLSPLSTPPSSSVDLLRLLDCIGVVESNSQDAAKGMSETGKVVARGRYQITEPTWFQHTNRPWKNAHIRSWSDEVGRRHLGWLTCYLTKPITPFWLGYAWRTGLSYTNKRIVGHAFENLAWYDHALRISNLYNDSRPKQIPKA